MSAMNWHQGQLQRIAVGGAKLECVCFGPPPAKAATIVLMHDGLGCVTTWHEFPERLADATGWGVFAFSRQGYGGSDPAQLPRPVDYLEREAQTVVKDVLDRIGFETGILLGHSDGASIAGLYLGTHQDHRVRGLVLIAPHFFAEPENFDVIRQLYNQYETADLREKLARHHGDNVDCAFRGWADTWLDPRFANWDATEAIAYIRVPVLYIQGEDDHSCSPAQAEAVVDACYAPVDVHMIADCQHVPHREQPDKTLLLIGEFVARLARIENHNVSAP